LQCEVLYQMEENFQILIDSQLSRRKPGKEIIGQLSFDSC